MRSYLMICLIMIILCPVNGQEDRIIKPGNFTGIHVSSGIDAELIRAAEPAVGLNFDNTSTSQLIAEVKGNTLKLRMKTGKYQQGSLRVKIYFKDELNSIRSDSRANIWSNEELHLSNVITKLSNGGSISLEIVSDHLIAELSQGSIFMVSGKVKLLDLKVATAATFSGYNLMAEDANILANSGGKAKVSVSHYLNGKAISGGWIGYLTVPEKIDSKVSLKGEIVRTYTNEQN